jgi:hypothetical protein
MMKRLTLCSLSAALVGALGAASGSVPSTFTFELPARPELHRLWEASTSAKAERVACLAASLDGDTVRISRVAALETPRADSLGISAASSLEQCRPPEWRGTVHTHVALRNGLPYSLFSGADRGVMMLWWRRWNVDGLFCLLYSSTEVICEMEGPERAVLFPRSRY